jgi:hypothetical protein
MKLKTVVVNPTAIISSIIAAIIKKVAENDKLLMLRRAAIYMLGQSEKQ